MASRFPNEHGRKQSGQLSDVILTSSAAAILAAAMFVGDRMTASTLPAGAAAVGSAYFTFTVVRQVSVNCIAAGVGLHRCKRRLLLRGHG